MAFYTGVDQERYDAGEKFLPQNRFLLNYTAPNTDVEEEVTTSYGIPNTNAFTNAGGGGGTFYSSDQKISDFNKAIAERQNRLENPGWMQQQINKFTGGQRPVSEMGTVQYNPNFTRSYSDGMTSFGLPVEGLGDGAFGEMPMVPQPDERLLGKIPLGIGSMISMALPDKYYSDFTTPEQALTQMYMGYTDPNTNMGNKDPFGINVRSGFGNYAEYSGEQVGKLNTALTNSAERFSKKHGVNITFNEITGQAESDDEDALNEWNRLTNNMQTRLGHYGKVTRNFNTLKHNHEVAKKQRDAWEKETAREQDWADKKFKETGDYDEYSGAGGSPNFTIHDPSTTAKGYTYEGSDEQDKDNEGASNTGGNWGNDPGTPGGWSPGAKDGGRIGLRYGGLASIL